MSETKTCSKCGIEKAVTEFTRKGVGRRTGRTWYKGTCKVCTRKPPGTLTRAANLRHFYGITLDHFERLLAAQGGGCAICGTTVPGGHGGFHVDHDHSCCPGKRACGGCVRGLLCHSCNTGIGSLGDCVERLASAVEYLLEADIERWQHYVPDEL